MRQHEQQASKLRITYLRRYRRDRGTCFKSARIANCQSRNAKRRYVYSCIFEKLHFRYLVNKIFNSLSLRYGTVAPHGAAKRGAFTFQKWLQSAIKLSKNNYRGRYAIASTRRQAASKLIFFGPALEMKKSFNEWLKLWYFISTISSKPIEWYTYK